MNSDQVEVDVREYLRAVYRRRRLAAAGFAIPVVIAFVYAFTDTPQYFAIARLLIEPDTPNVVAFQEVIARRDQQVLPNVMTTHHNLLQSRNLARATLDQLDAWDHPDFRDENFHPRRAVVRALSSLRSAIFRSPYRTDGPVGTETLAESRAISILQAKLVITTAGNNSRVIVLAYLASDNQLAADVVNTVARLHVERDVEFRNTTSRDASEWLQQRITEQRERLEASERALQRYREEHGAVAVEDRQTIVVRELENLHSAVTTATMARIESEARYRDLQDAQDDPDSLGRFPEILRNEIIQEQKLTLAGLRRDRVRLAEELGPRHPDMISIESSIRDAEERLQNEILAVVDSLRIEFQVAASQERQLESELDRQTRQALALDRTGIEYGVIQREAESDRRLYESLLQRAAETGMTSELKTSNVRIIDPARTPLEPARPRWELIMLVGLLGGTFLAVGLVFGVEYVDDRIKNPDEVKIHVAAPYLGMVPDVSAEVASARRRTDSPGFLTLPPPSPILDIEGTPANFVESIRSLRTNLLFSSADDGGRIVVLTSTIPSEGKSCISANLGVALAQLDLRTLLVDSDLRSPRQHANFRVDLEPGLSNLLVGDTEASAVVRSTDVANLSLVTAGKQPPDPAGLLGSERFAKILESWRERFDWVVVDTTPVLPVTDAVIVASVVRKALFIVGTGTTSRRTAADAMARLKEANAEVLGTVLNKAELARHAYYYSRYYSREYSRYYNRSPAA